MNIDPTLLAGAIATILAAATIAVVTVINALSKAKVEILIASLKANTKNEEILQKVNGNYSALKDEVVASKAETNAANQKIAVLIERLITSTPTNNHTTINTPVPVAVVNSQPVPVTETPEKK